MAAAVPPASNLNSGRDRFSVTSSRIHQDLALHDETDHVLLDPPFILHHLLSGSLVAVGYSHNLPWNLTKTHLVIMHGALLLPKTSSDIDSSHNFGFSPENFFKFKSRFQSQVLKVSKHLELNFLLLSRREMRIKPHANALRS